MGCNCGSASTPVAPNWIVSGPDGTYIGSYRTEIEAASVASRTPGATYRPDR